MGDDEIEGTEDVMATFASTFEELHYFLGGGCLGFVLGWLACAVWELLRRRVAP